MNVMHVIVGEPTERGIWCNDCNLPSIIAFPFHMLSTRGVSNSYMLHCPGCKERTEGAP